MPWNMPRKTYQHTGVDKNDVLAGLKFWNGSKNNWMGSLMTHIFFCAIQIDSRHIRSLKNECEGVIFQYHDRDDQIFIYSCILSPTRFCWICHTEIHFSFCFSEQNSIKVLPLPNSGRYCDDFAWSGFWTFGSQWKIMQKRNPGSGSFPKLFSIADFLVIFLFSAKSKSSQNRTSDKW